MTTKIAEQLPDGPYKLTKGVINVCSDGRKRGWKHEAEFPPGRYFVSQIEGGSAPVLYVQRDGDEGSLMIGRRTAAYYTEFLGTLDPDPSLRGALRFAKAEHYVYPIDVLLLLVADGKISEADVRAAISSEVERHNADAVEHAEHAEAK